MFLFNSLTYPPARNSGQKTDNDAMEQNIKVVMAQA